MRSLLLSSLALLPALALAQPDASSFPSCLAGLQKKAQAQGISADSYERFTSGLQADLSVLDLLDAQPEFTTPLWDYLAGLVDEQRVSDGKAMLAQHDKLLDQVAARYGVDKYTVVAVWGVESDYGRIFGKRPLLTSLSTLSCYGRRQSFFQGEFLATLKLLQAGDIRDAGITGSWAGAFGHTQFMPSTYARIAVDFDGDGRRDLVGSVPDALGSTANYLKKAGWRTGQPWGYEVKVPADFPASLAGRGKRQPLSAWVARGVRRVDGQPLPGGDEKAAILLPTGAQGPAFLVYRNYDAIYSYNAAESYALAIALLSDR
ncbi:lytic murein transglycosylase, partial [Pseudomonas aeruginosa]